MIVSFICTAINSRLQFEVVPETRFEDIQKSLAIKHGWTPENIEIICDGAVLAPGAVGEILMEAKACIYFPLETLIVQTLALPSRQVIQRCLWEDYNPNSDQVNYIANAALVHNGPLLWTGNTATLFAVEPSLLEMAASAWDHILEVDWVSVKLCDTIFVPVPVEDCRFVHDILIQLFGDLSREYRIEIDGLKPIETLLYRHGRYSRISIRHNSFRPTYPDAQPRDEFDPFWVNVCDIYGVVETFDIFWFTTVDQLSKMIEVTFGVMIEHQHLFHDCVRITKDYDINLVRGGFIHLLSSVSEGCCFDFTLCESKEGELVQIGKPSSCLASVKLGQYAEFMRDSRRPILAQSKDPTVPLFAAAKPIFKNDGTCYYAIILA